MSSITNPPASAAAAAAPLNLVATTSAVDLSNKLLAGDANNSWQITGDGKIQWGAGGAGALDTTFYRSAAGQLKTDGQLTFAPQAAAPLLGAQVAANPVLQNRLLAADANPAVQIRGDGIFAIGPGGASPLDVFLSRDATAVALVQSTVNGGAGAALQNNAASGFSGCELRDNGGVARGFFGTQGANEFRINAVGAVPLRFLQNSVERLRIDATADMQVTGLNLRLMSVGNGLRVAEGANAKQGVSAAMVAGSVVVANTSVTASSRIVLTRQDGGTNPGAVYVSARTAGASFTVASTNALDTGTVAYQIFEPA